MYSDHIGMKKNFGMDRIQYELEIAMVPHKVLDEISANRQRYVEELAEFLRIPSVSTEPDHAADIRQAAIWVVNKLQKLNFQVELRETARHPVVYGHLVIDASLPTLLIYGHYDVQPADPLDEWITPPSPQVSGKVTSMLAGPQIIRDNALPIWRPWKRCCL